MRRNFLLALALLAVAGTAAADTSCIYPQAPTTLPDGRTATLEEMVEARRIVLAFDTDIRTYATCIELEARQVINDPNVDERSKQNVMSLLVQRNEAAISHAELVVGRFNEQLKLYRENNPPQ